MKTILFQGDSITDCGRSKQGGIRMGEGYAMLVKTYLAFENPNEYEFYNRGISGNRIVDVYARIKSDIINLKPDYMSLLIGVNDVWHEIEAQNGVDADKFEKIYCMLIEEIKAALPDIKLMILEPFCLRGPATDNTEEKPVLQQKESKINNLLENLAKDAPKDHFTMGIVDDVTKLSLKEKIDASQREFLLREKIRIIKEELGESTIKDAETAASGI